LSQRTTDLSVVKTQDNDLKEHNRLLEEHTRVLRERNCIDRRDEMRMSWASAIAYVKKKRELAAQPNAEPPKANPALPASIAMKLKDPYTHPAMTLEEVMQVLNKSKSAIYRDVRLKRAGGMFNTISVMKIFGLK